MTHVDGNRFAISTAEAIKELAASVILRAILDVQSAANPSRFKMARVDHMASAVGFLNGIGVYKPMRDAWCALAEIDVDAMVEGLKTDLAVCKSKCRERYDERIIPDPPKVTRDAFYAPAMPFFRGKAKIGP